MIWEIAALLLVAGLVVCVLAAARGTPETGLVAFEMGTVLAILALLFFEQWFERQTFFDVSLALAVLAFPSSLLFVRFYRRWL